MKTTPDTKHIPIGKLNLFEFSSSIVSSFKSLSSLVLISNSSFSLIYLKSCNLEINVNNVSLSTSP